MWFVSEKKYKRLLEENEDLKNLYNNLKVRFISLNEEYCSFRLAQKEEKKKARGEVYLLNENEKLTEWIRDILKVFGEEQPDNCTVPIKIPYFKHNKEFNNVVSCGFLPKEGKAGYIPTEEIIIPELHIIVRGI
jgi:hypothetical protein|nr:MAG TPA: hypothetical protein [Caudoviricetes sp.]